MSQVFPKAARRRTFRWPRVLVAVALGFLLTLASGNAASTQFGVINDPDGYVNVRAARSVTAKVVTTLKVGEPFRFEWGEGNPWCKVTTKSGKSGWVHQSRIRLHFTEQSLPSPEKDPAGPSEVEEVDAARGLDYVAITHRAAGGDEKALKDFFQLGPDLDGAAAETHAGVPTAVYHLLGDQRFAAFLAVQPLDFQVMVRNEILGDPGGPMLMPDPESYLRRHFFETTAVLFRQEIVDWVSPDKRYAIRKVFSAGELAGSRVIRAELIDRQRNEVLLDLTKHDLGTGADREGGVLWSPDSQRFAYLSMDLSRSAGNLWSTPTPPPQVKQTVLFQRSGNAFSRVDLAFEDPPVADRKERLKGAVLGHRHTQPLRWEKPDTLILQHHEYYEKLEPSNMDGVKFEAIKPFDLLYEIRVTFTPDGKAQADWEEQRDR